MIKSRRHFLSTSAGIGFAALGSRAWGDGRPPVTNPRATDGDERFEPSWDEKLTLTVGTGKSAAEADMSGRDQRVIQAAVDSVARVGGGTVKVLPGVFTFRAAVILPSHVRLIGSGPETVFTKIPSESVKVVADSDWYDQEITVANARSFRVGDGVVLRCKNPHHGGATVIKRTIVAKSGNRLKLHDGLRENLWLSGEPTCTSLFPLLTSEHTSDVVIENLALDGNSPNNENFNGNYGGGIFLQDCNRYTFRNVESHHYNGDGFSFQICHDVLVDRCHSHDNADLGVHPGSGSQRPLVRDCRLERNGIGLFWCWGVKYGLAERNRIVDNRNYGISIGHNDTDNVMRHNEISGSGKVGILFRDESRGADFWANRNVVEDNRISNSGGPEGIAVDIQGQTKDIRLARNQIEETRESLQRTAIRISPRAERIELTDNRISGFATAVLDQRSKARVS